MNREGEESSDTRRGFSGISSMVSDVEGLQSAERVLEENEPVVFANTESTTTSSETSADIRNQGGKRRLSRSGTSKAVAGVCGGLGEYLGVDPVFIRLIWLAVLFFGGTGLLLYLIAWIVLPISNEGTRMNGMGKTDAGKIFGVIFIIVAIALLGSGSGWNFEFIPREWLAPISLVALGFAFLLRRRN